MSKPLVSVIIPVKNAERYLNETIDSVLAQTYAPIEVLVVDGQSTDGTRDLAQSYPEVRYVCEEGAPSIANGRNLGIKEAKGELIAFVSGDDRWLPNKIALQAEALRLDPSAAYSICKLRFFLEDGEAMPRGFRPELLEKDVLGSMPETLLARASLFEEVGLFDGQYGLAEDLDWFQRVRDRGCVVAAVEETLLHKRVHDQSLSLGSAAAAKDAIRLMRARAKQGKTG